MIKCLNKIRKDIINFLIICTCCCPIHLYADWELVGSEYLSDGYKECLELVFSNGIPYVVFAEQRTSPEMSGISVMKLENNHWTYVGQPGFAGNFYDNVGAVGMSFSNDTPYVYFRDDEYDGKASVLKFDGANWVSVGPRGFSDSAIAFGNIVVSEGVPFVVFRDYYEVPTNFAIKVMKFDGMNWVYVGNPEINSPSNFPALFFFNDTAFVTYMDNNNSSRAGIKKFNGNNWVNVGNQGFNNCEISGTSINMSFCTTEPLSGVPFVALSNTCQYNVPSVTTVYKLANNQWEQIGTVGNVDTLYGNHWDLHISLKGVNPQIAFIEAGHTYVKEYDGVNWLNLGDPNTLPGSYTIDFEFTQGSSYLAYASHNGSIGLLRFQDSPLNIELDFFSAIVMSKDVQLNWSTSAEKNNSGFDIERSSIENQWIKVGFVSGHGTISELLNYSFTDKNLTTGKYKFRLKQIDFNGNFEYFNLAEEVSIGIPDKFELSQNYPNPFNPVTNLEYGIAKLGFVSLKIYDVLGRELVTLVNEIKEPGYNKIKFDAGNLSSGVYFYRLVVSTPNPITADDFVAVKKFVVMK